MLENSPPLQRTGGRAINKIDPFRNRRGRGGQIGEIFRPEDFSELTTPSAAHRWLRNLYLMPQPPLLAEEGNTPHSAFLQFIHGSIDAPLQPTPASLLFPWPAEE